MHCIQVFYPTGTEARIASTIGRVECLCRLGGGGRCADLDVAARDAIKERLLLRAVATCCADRVEHRAAHYNVRWSLADGLTYPRALALTLITWISEARPRWKVQSAESLPLIRRSCSLKSQAPQNSALASSHSTVGKAQLLLRRRSGL